MSNQQTYQERFARKVPFLTRSIAEGATYQEIASVLGVSVARVGQLEATAMERFRRCWEMIEAGTPVDDAIEACKGRNGRPRKKREGRRP